MVLPLLYKHCLMNNISLLQSLAAKYESSEFIIGDPSWFMHQVEGQLNQETIAFIASSLSYGSRKQFMPKIQFILDSSKGEVYKWIKCGEYNNFIPNNPNECFYRLYSMQTMSLFLQTLQKLFVEYHSLGEYIRHNATDGYSAINVICEYFSANGIEGIIPKNTSSACKRICMFLRWMVRDNSPVDLGLWRTFIDKKTLIMPLDTHVIQEAQHLGLIKTATASMTTARKLTEIMCKVFPDDPLKGDFALFGYGVNK